MVLRPWPEKEFFELQIVMQDKFVVNCTGMIAQIFSVSI